MAVKTFYQTSFIAPYNTGYVDLSNAGNDSTSNYAYKTLDPYKGGSTWSTSNTAGTTNFGTISAVSVEPYYYHTDPSKNVRFGTAVTTGRPSDEAIKVTVDRSVAHGPAAYSINVTSLRGSWTWTNVSQIRTEWSIWEITTERLYRIRIYVTYTPVASTATWTNPAASSTHYRAGSGVYISGTAANPNGVNAVQYKVDSGSWVTCSGTTSWSATIPQSSLTHGSHVITIAVQDASTDNAWTTIATTRTITQSSLPSQML